MHTQMKFQEERNRNREIDRSIGRWRCFRWRAGGCGIYSLKRGQGLGPWLHRWVSLKRIGEIIQCFRPNGFWCYKLTWLAAIRGHIGPGLCQVLIEVIIFKNSILLHLQKSMYLAHKPPYPHANFVRFSSSVKSVVISFITSQITLY